MEIDWISVSTGTLTFIVLLVIKTLLDFKIARFLVKWLYWLPVRSIFRSKPIPISGKWDQEWSCSDSENFTTATERHSHPEIKQFGSYCYGEFLSKGKTYVIFGEIIDRYFVGDWSDKEDPDGYFGAFQLYIKDTKTMEGVWIGHSKNTLKIKSDHWNWKKI